MDRLSVVLPVMAHTHHGHSELDRIRDLLFPSFARFVDPECIETFWVVVRPDERASIQELVAPWKDAFSIELVSEDDVAPRAAGVAGWVKQQILKLAMSHTVATEQYLVLDSDVLAVRPTGWEDLCPGGLGVPGWEPLATHEKWWRASNAILGIDLAWGPDERVMGVTPQILSTPVVQRLLDRIESHGRRWPWSRRGWERILLARPGWTEYSLYWSLLCDEFDPADYYTFDAGQLYGNCIWTDAGGFGPEHVRRMFEHPDAPFAVLQSNIEALEVGEVARLVRPWLSS